MTQFCFIETTDILEDKSSCSYLKNKMIHPVHWSYNAENKDDTTMKTIAFLVKQIRDLAYIVQIPIKTTVSITFAH